MIGPALCAVCYVVSNEQLLSEPEIAKEYSKLRKWKEETRNL